MSSSAVHYSRDTLEIFENLKSMILSNAKLQHGGSISGRPRTYDITTSTRARSQSQWRVFLIGYDESHKGPGKVDIDSKVIQRSGVKNSLILAMEDLLRKTQEDLWKD